MRKLLNNPVIVIPLACFALLWLLHSYGLTQYLLKQFVGQTRRVDAPPFVQNNKANASTKSEKAMGTLVADRWLISSWARTSIAKNEPFVANGLQKNLNYLIHLKSKSKSKMRKWLSWTKRHLMRPLFPRLA